MADLVVECNPTAQECRALVERISASGEFRRTTRLRSFLLYVVDRKLAHASHEITETLIGHRVFGRPPSYNTGEDSIVRTEARLLRQRLERYFSNEGLSEPLCLRSPRDRMFPYFTDVSRKPNDQSLCRWYDEHAAEPRFGFRCPRSLSCQVSSWGGCWGFFHSLQRRPLSLPMLGARAR
jgi:hypothetical protein